jgi:EAL domain-containing protein (putative c-di-GMP-specific phosphodiesterase class I)
LDALKLDRSFVSRITADERARSLACSMVAIAKSLNMIVVAEGVETSEELAVLRTMGCDVIQGFLLSRAVDAKNLDLPALRARMDEYGSRELPPLWVA